MNTCLLGKTYVITGATSGIGLATVERLVLYGANIIAVGRTEEHCQQASEKVHALQPTGRTAWLAADFSRMSNVHALGDEVHGQLERWEIKGIDGLVNNAATVPYRQILTPDGFDTQWAVNHLAAFLLTIRLLPTLRKAGTTRILTISSGSHYHARMHWEDLQLLKNYSPLRAYGQSKLCNVLFSAELKRRFAGSNVHVFAVDPGLVKTDIGFKSNSNLAKWIWILRRRSGISPQESSFWIVFLISESSILNSKELYWKHGIPKAPNPIALDKPSAQRLWDLSMKMCGI